MFSLLLISAFTSLARAQTLEEDRVQSLGEIFNPEGPSLNQQATSSELANIYFENCLNKESLAFNDTEKETLCACTSSNIAETMDTEEVKLLEASGKKGKDARSKMLAFSYAPCMQHVIETKVQGDCYTSGYLDDIIRGKQLICGCVAKRYQELINKNAAFIITDAMHYNPMTLNPLEDYFTKVNYFAQQNHFIKQCKYQFSYDRDNK